MMPVEKFSGKRTTPPWVTPPTFSVITWSSAAAP
jgi:hypothetical protein